MKIKHLAILFYLLLVFSIQEGFANSRGSTVMDNGLNRVESKLAYNTGVESFTNSYSYNSFSNPPYWAEKGHKIGELSTPSGSTSTGSYRGLSATERFIFVPIDNQNYIDNMVRVELSPEVVSILDSLMAKKQTDTVSINRVLDIMERNSENDYLFRYTLLDSFEVFVKKQERKQEMEAKAYPLWILLLIVSWFMKRRATKNNNRLDESMWTLLLVLSVFCVISFFSSISVLL